MKLEKTNGISALLDFSSLIKTKFIDNGTLEARPLGKRGQLTRGYMLIILCFFKQFVHTFPRVNMLITFWKCPSIHSQFPQGIHCDCFQKVATNGITKYPGGTWGYIKKKAIKEALSHSLKEPPGFFPNSTHNVASMALSHSFKPLSRSSHQCNQNVPVGFCECIHKKLSKKSLGISWMLLPGTQRTGATIQSDLKEILPTRCSPVNNL